ncbi:hypothetical protein D210916BOD24_35300 [Alteromonas sp. D210916BOD_24]|uniref:hypothetical protein n=1 Tax=Alteromonas sp. D210916BOD_24 TaxID=3157618 RepID=UPI00399CC71E
MRLLIFGNSGSGKSTLAKHLEKVTKIPHYDLDRIFWLDNNFQKTHPHKKSQKVVKEISFDDNWIIEGTYTHLLKAAKDRASVMIWLNKPSRECIKNSILREGSISDFRRSRINEYYDRKNGTSYKSHFQLWNSFSKSKYKINSNSYCIKFFCEGLLEHASVETFY